MRKGIRQWWLVLNVGAQIGLVRADGNFVDNSCGSG
jgi:hypothetical protein